MTKQNRTHQATAVTVLRATSVALESNPAAAAELLGHLINALEQNSRRITLDLASDIIDSVDNVLLSHPPKGDSPLQSDLGYEVEMLLCDEDNRVDQYGPDGWTVLNPNVQKAAAAFVSPSLCSMGLDAF